MPDVPDVPDVRVVPERVELLVVGDVLTMDAARRRYRQGAVAVGDGAVVAVGALDALRARWPRTPELGGPGHIVTPGFVDAHQHLTGDRLVRASIPDHLSAEVAITRWAVPLHAALTAEDDSLAATLAAAEALAAGVTTVIDAGTVAHPSAVAAACRAAGIRARVGRWGSDAPGLPQTGSVHDVIERQRALLDELGASPTDLVHAHVALVGHDLMSDELVVAASVLARERDAALTFHLSPDRRDGAAYVARTGRRPLVHLRGLGVLGDHVLVAHAVHIDDGELDALVATQTAVAACPWAYLRLAQGVTTGGRYGELLARGGRLALGCDSENAGDRIDVLGAAALLAGLVRDRAEDPTVGTAADALALATSAGAAAVGLGEVVGSITVGRRADLVVLRPPAPAGDPYLELVWGQGVRSVRHVLVDGHVVVRDGAVTTIDVGAAGVAAAQRRVALARAAGLEL